MNLDFNHSTTNVDLIQLCAALHVSLNGVLMRDELPSSWMQGGYIFNLDSSRGLGSHWVCLLVGQHDVFYHDSYGFPMPDNMLRSLKKTMKTIYWSSTRKQQVDSLICGYYCLLFLHWMTHNVKVKSLVDRANAFDHLFWGMDDDDCDALVENKMLQLIKRK